MLSDWAIYRQLGYSNCRYAVKFFFRRLIAIWAIFNYHKYKFYFVIVFSSITKSYLKSDHFTLYSWHPSIAIRNSLWLARKDAHAYIFLFDKDIWSSHLFVIINDWATFGLLPRPHWRFLEKLFWLHWATPHLKKLRQFSFLFSGLILNNR